MSVDKIIVHIDMDLEDLIPGFLENRQQDVKNLESAVQENDFEKIKSIGHNLKGLGGGYGFHDMSNIGAEIENDAKATNIERISENIKKLSSYLSNIEIIYEEI